MLSRSYWVGVAAGVAFAVALGVFDERAALVHQTDFAGYWAGGRALLIGADPYDPARWRDTVALIGTQPPDTMVYGYTPWVALAMTPLALLPLDIAAALWAIVGLALASIGIAVLLRTSACPSPARAAIGFLVAGSQPAQTALIVGQWSLVLTGMMSLATAAVVARRPLRAIAPLLFALAKPQLFLVTVPALLWRRWRAAGLFVAVCVAIVAVATVFMPGWITAWTQYVPAQRLTDPPRAAVLASLGVELFGRAGTWIAEALVVAIAVVAALRFGVRAVSALPSWLAVSVLAAPYSWSYDWLLLVVPLALAADVLAADHPRRSLALVIVGAVLLTVGASVAYAVAVTRGRETYSAIVPLAVTVSLIAALWPLAGPKRSAAPASPGRSAAR